MMIEYGPNPDLPGSGDEALDLPARSRFGEGRAETFYRSTTSLQAHGKLALHDTVSE
jgi:hypothetical protein